MHRFSLSLSLSYFCFLLLCVFICCHLLPPLFPSLFLQQLTSVASQIQAEQLFSRRRCQTNVYNIHEGLSKYFLTLHKHNSLPLWPIRAFISSHYLKSSMSKLSLSLSLFLRHTLFQQPTLTFMHPSPSLSLFNYLNSSLSLSLSCASPSYYTLSLSISLSLSNSRYMFRTPGILFFVLVELLRSPESDFLEISFQNNFGKKIVFLFLSVFIKRCKIN